MLCDECNLNEASYTVSLMMEGQITTRHLCPECMARVNTHMNAQTVKTLLSSIMAAITGERVASAQEEEEEDDLNSPACPRCGMKFSQYKRSGKLGCPACYEAFREQLRPMLLKIHGRVQHAGRRPLCTEAAQRSRTRQEELSREMALAVSLEDFETAARLRDQIRALAREEKEAQP